MENKTIVTKASNQQKKECSGQNTNILFGCIFLFVACAIIIGIGIYLMIAHDAIFSGIMWGFWGVFFAIINVILNKNILFKNKKTNQSKDNKNKN